MLVHVTAVSAAPHVKEPVQSFTNIVLASLQPKLSPKLQLACDVWQGNFPDRKRIERRGCVRETGGTDTDNAG